MIQLIPRLIPISTIAKYSAHIAPYVGGFTILASMQTSPNSGLVEVWRTVLTVSIGIFVALIGVIYKDYVRRFDAMEVRISQSEDRQERALGLMLSVVLSPSTPNEKITDLIKMMFEGSK